MALTLGTNCGFVTTAPTSDPAASAYGIDNYVHAMKVTSPAGSNNLTEIGWWQSNGGNDAAAYECGIYSHDAVEDEPNAIVGSVSTGQSTTASTTAWNKYTGLSQAITASTTYWLGVFVENVGGANRTDRTTGTGTRICTMAAAVELYTNWDDGKSSSILDQTEAIFGKYEAAGGFTLTADSGTFTQTGTAADLLKGSLVGADSGTYSQTGTDASLLFNRKITADGGTYTQTGSDISFLYDRVIDIETGEYLLTGSDVNFGGARTISADSGTYTQTGFDATLRENSLIDIENGTFSLTGTDNDLSTNRILRSDSGSFIHTGSNATLIYAGDIVIICDAGEYLCVDGSADLSYSGESTGLSMVRDVVQPVVRDVVCEIVR